MLNLDEKRYRIYVLGGWGVKLNDFGISFINQQTDAVVKSKKSFWPVQTNSYSRRAKRILIVDIPASGEYKVVFHSPDSIKVKWSNLFLISRIHSNIPTKEIDVLITTKLGMNLIIN